MMLLKKPKLPTIAIKAVTLLRNLLKVILARVLELISNLHR